MVCKDSSDAIIDCGSTDAHSVCTKDDVLVNCDTEEPISGDASSEMVCKNLSDEIIDCESTDADSVCTKDDEQVDCDTEEPISDNASS